MPSDVKAVTFDVDGTLYASRAIRFPMLLANWWRLSALRVGMRVREELRTRAFESGQAMRDEEARIVGERMDLDPAKARAILDEIFDASLSRVLPRARHFGLRETLESLLATGVKIAVVSDRRVDDKLRALKLDDLPWVARISAEDTGWLKPDPRPFLRACETLGMNPSEVRHIGDRDDTDGAGARAAGLSYVRVSGPAEIARAVDDLMAGAVSAQRR
jgi:putative hydrolase of the HAD superfamily